MKIIRDIAMDVWPKTFRDILAPGQIAYMMRMMYAPDVMERELAEGFSFEVLRLDGEPVGYVSYAPYGEPGEAKLHKIYLLEKCQGRGYGSLLLRHVSDRCRESGFIGLRLNVNKHNRRAIRAYLRNGFVQIASVNMDIGGGYFMDDFVMRRDLRHDDGGADSSGVR